MVKKPDITNAFIHKIIMKSLIQWSGAAEILYSTANLSGMEYPEACILVN